jgi:hypothetical protein
VRSVIVPQPNGAKALYRRDLPSAALTVEITEKFLVGNLDRSARTTEIAARQTLSIVWLRSVPAQTIRRLMRRVAVRLRTAARLRP